MIFKVLSNPGPLHDSVIIEEKLLFVLSDCLWVPFVTWTGDWSCSVAFPLVQLLVLKQHREETLNQSITEIQAVRRTELWQQMLRCCYTEITCHYSISVSTVQEYVKCLDQ